jgi:hypothetical protein
MDFFTVPMPTFGILYCFFVIAHERRRILHFDVASNPTSVWVVQQSRKAFPYDTETKHPIFNLGSSFCEDTIEVVKCFGIASNASQLPQPVAERCCRALGRHLQP